MSSSIAIRVRDVKTGYSQDYFFARLPIRIGRNTLNDLRLDLPFISQFHAVVEERDGKLAVRDLGSRNGITVSPVGRPPADTSIDLEPAGHVFGIGALQFEVMLSQASVAAAQSAGLNLLELLGDRPRPRTAAQEAMVAATRAWARGGMAPLYQAHRQSWDRVFAELTQALSHVDESARGAVLQDLATSFPKLTNEEQFEHLLRAHHAASGISEAADQRGAETTALLALNHMLKALTGREQALRSSDQVLATLQRLSELLQVFFRIFIPVRDGFRELGSSHDTGRENNPGTVEGARTPEELANVIFFAEGRGDEAARAVHASLTDVMMHQTTTLETVVRGIGTLFAQLSPAAIEEAVDADRGGRYGSTLGPMRYRALWRAYAERHADFADEQGHTFSVLFGKTMVRARSRSALVEPITGAQEFSFAPAPRPAPLDRPDADRWSSPVAPPIQEAPIPSTAPVVAPATAGETEYIEAFRDEPPPWQKPGGR